MSGKSAVVAGATGLVGGELVRQLCESSVHSRVTVYVRDSAKARFSHESDKLVVRSFPEDDESIQGDEFYCALGTTIRKAGSKAAFSAVDHDLVIDLAKRAKVGGVSRVVVVTSVGSDSRSKNFYLRVKGQTENDLLSLGIDRLEIYRPSLLLGSREEWRPLESLGVAFAPFLSLVFCGVLAKYRPIAASELARKMIAAEPLNV